MANSNIKHLEFLPLDEDNLIINDSPTSNVRSKACMNLGFEVLNTNERFINIANINNKSIANSNSFMQLAYSLETMLINCVSLSSISNPGNTDTTEHYKKRLEVISNAKILPSFSYCQNLLFTNFKIWVNYYGTLGYYISLLEEYDEYLTPSEIIYKSVLSLCDYNNSLAYNKFLITGNNSFLICQELYSKYKELINKEDYISDKELYNLSKDFIQSIPLIQDIYGDLIFYEQWLPKVFNWYSNLKDTTINEEALDNKTLAKNTLVKIVKSFLSNGLTSKNINGVSSRFIKQSINNNIFERFEELINIRLQSKYTEKIDYAPSNEEELLVIELFNRIPSIQKTYRYLDARNFILEVFAAPGGYSLLLISLAATLFNRAYILSYEKRLFTEDIQTSKTYKRVLKLVGYGAILLIKTSLPSAQLFGSNILKAFNLYIQDINPTNLLDL